MSNRKWWSQWKNYTKQELKWLYACMNRLYKTMTMQRLPFIVLFTSRINDELQMNWFVPILSALFFFLIWSSEIIFVIVGNIFTHDLCLDSVTWLYKPKTKKIIKQNLTNICKVPLKENKSKKQTLKTTSYKYLIDDGKYKF